MSAIPFKQQEVYYPESDGKPVAESDIHIDELLTARHALKEHFRAVEDVYAAGNMLLYYVQGDPRKCVAPDVFVVRGVPKRRRNIFKLWEEGHAPCFVLEITSDTTRSEDLRKKKDLYQDLGVEEYFLFDPLQDYLKPSLQGFRLVDGRYQPIPSEVDGSLASRTTGTRLRREGHEKLRFVNAETGEPLVRIEELRDLADTAAEALREADGERRKARSAEVERQRAEEERQQMKARLAEETAARRAAEEELARLRRELESRK
ncbi:MAG TPA: Uma2 family endonuclease [Thermoanaerobaculia bacterium]|nr:Uma2 family endonuclease [Thermoanaerobaculia bacterium]